MWDGPRGYCYTGMFESTLVQGSPFKGKIDRATLIGKYGKNRIFEVSVKNDDFLDFSRYGSWRPLDVSKTLSEDVRTFSTIENIILRTSLFGPFLTPPPGGFGPESTGKKNRIWGFAVKNTVFLLFRLIWQLEASRCVQKDVRGCANIFHYRPAHSENFTFSIIFEPMISNR